LLADIDPERLKRLVGDPVIFEQTLKQTRNYLTHPGIEQKRVGTKDRRSYSFSIIAARIVAPRAAQGDGILRTGHFRSNVSAVAHVFVTPAASSARLEAAAGNLPHY
jgi:hypothetical protein